MHIVLYHDALIPPANYGGTERIIYWLGKALAARGLRVTLIAQPGSEIPGVEVIPLESHLHWTDLIPSQADILHLWSTPSELPLKPFVVTIEGNGKPGECFHPNTIFISQKHAENHGSKHFVYNGIDPEDFQGFGKRGEDLVFLAKASWSVKNLSGAISVARKAGLKLHVLGSRNCPLSVHRFFGNLGQIRYHGMVGDKEKREVLAQAKALLFPVRWHEPFGIAITEALASGCPVFGTPYGSLPEIISHDVGYLSADGNILAEKIHEMKISPATCRARLSQGFTSHQMAGNYLTYYEKVLQTGSLLNPGEPSPRTPATPALTDLLPWIDAD